MAKSFASQLVELVEEYMQAHQVEEVDLDDVSAWACRTEKYQRPPISMQKQCRREMARALRQTRHIDPQEREVRTKHAVEIKLKGEQFVLWVDIRTAKPNTMRKSFSQNRERIACDVRRHSTDVDSYNDNNLYGATLPLFDYDFNKDLVEAKMSGLYDDGDGLYDDRDEDDVKTVVSRDYDDGDGRYDDGDEDDAKSRPVATAS